MKPGNKELELQKLAWYFACRKKDREKKELRPLKEVYHEEFSSWLEDLGVCKKKDDKQTV